MFFLNYFIDTLLKFYHAGLNNLITALLIINNFQTLFFLFIRFLTLYIIIIFIRLLLVLLLIKINLFFTGNINQFIFQKLPLPLNYLFRLFPLYLLIISRFKGWRFSEIRYLSFLPIA